MWAWIICILCVDCCCVYCCCTANTHNCPYGLKEHKLVLLKSVRMAAFSAYSVKGTVQSNPKHTYLRIRSKPHSMHMYLRVTLLDSRLSKHTQSASLSTLPLHMSIKTRFRIYSEVHPMGLLQSKCVFNTA